ncbi:MAG: SOS response-associated peptidase [Myxococcota bacterium]
MCGRMTLTRSADEIAAYFALAEAIPIPGPNGGPLEPRFNVAPSQRVLTLVESEGGSRLAAWKSWGLIPSWSKDPARGGSLFNARSETVDTKPSFRAAWKKRRCLVVADGFYEWSPRNQGHQPYYFTTQKWPLMAMAGLYEEWVDSSSDERGGRGGANGSGEVIESCTVLTTEANADLSDVHHRMPVLLRPEDFAAWLSPATAPETLKPLLAPSPDATLQRRAVSDYVNSARNDDAGCLSPPPPPPAPTHPQPTSEPEPPAQTELFAFTSPAPPEPVKKDGGVDS